MKKFVLMIAPFNTRSGYGDHARSIFYSIMNREDLDIKCIDVKWGNTPRNHLNPKVPRHKKLLDTFVDGNNIKQQPDVLIDIRIPNEFAGGAKVNIGITAGVETDVVSAEFLHGMNKMDLNIVPSEFTAATFRQCKYDQMQDLPDGQKQKIGDIKLDKPIKVLFEGVDTDVYYPKEKYQLKKEDPILYGELDSLIKEKSAFLHVGQWGGKGEDDRKNIALLIKLFLKTFANLPNKPALVLKTSGANFSILDKHEICSRIKKIKGDFDGVDIPNIYLIHGDLTINEMSTLYNHPKIKAFVTLTHGEGFGRPMLEASCCDLPIIASKWSGQLDFLTDSESLLISGFLKEVPKSVLWPPIIIEPSKWFNVNEGDVVRKLRTFHKKEKIITKKAKRLSSKNRRNMSLKKMAEKFNKILDDVLQGIPQPIALNLPKLKKVTKDKDTKIKLPKLKKVT
jgi:glycosyltransferase involved in cell wall biosynthesis